MPLDATLLLAFIVTTAIAMIVPGPDMLFVLGCGARGGPRAGLLATCGVAVSEAIHVLLAAAGLTALFVALPAAYTVVKIAGACYLVYLGVQAIRHRGSMGQVEDGPAMTGRQAFLRGLMTNLLNPKMLTYTIALLPQFIRPEDGMIWLQFAVLGSILIVFEFLVDGTVGVLAGRIGDWLRQRRRMRVGLDVAVGGVFLGLGARLALDSDAR